MGERLYVIRKLRVNITTGIAFKSVSLMHDIQDIEIQVKSPMALYHALENQPDFLPDSHGLLSWAY